MTLTDFLRRCHIDIAEDYGALFLIQNPAKNLKLIEQELVLVGTLAAFGSAEDVIEHGHRALSAGASSDAIVEAVLAASIARGPKALKTALPLLSQLQILGRKANSSYVRQLSVQYFSSEFEELPMWVRLLEKFSPDSLASYAALRSQILAEGAAPRKTKELLTMLLNAITANPAGIRSHAMAAIRSGSNKEEIADVLLLGVQIGGIVVWINGVSAIADILATERNNG